MPAAGYARLGTSDDAADATRTLARKTKGRTDMQRKIALLVQALIVAGAVAGFSLAASAQTHYRFAHDQQLNSGIASPTTSFPPSSNSSAAGRWSSISI